MDADQLVKKVTQATGFTRSAGVEVMLAEPGHTILRLPRKPELLQFNGFFHGGAVAGLADHAAGAAATTALSPGKVAVTVDLHVNYLAPADTLAILAEANVVSGGGTISVVSVQVFNEVAGTDEGSARVLCAIATATLRAVPFSSAS